MNSNSIDKFIISGKEGNEMMIVKGIVKKNIEDSLNKTEEKSESNEIKEEIQKQIIILGNRLYLKSQIFELLVNGDTGFEKENNNINIFPGVGILKEGNPLFLNKKYVQIVGEPSGIKNSLDLKKEIIKGNGLFSGSLTEESKKFGRELVDELKKYNFYKEKKLTYIDGNSAGWNSSNDQDGYEVRSGQIITNGFYQPRNRNYNINQLDYTQYGDMQELQIKMSDDLNSLIALLSRQKILLETKNIQELQDIYFIAKTLDVLWFESQFLLNTTRNGKMDNLNLSYANLTNKPLNEIKKGNFGISYDEDTNKIIKSKIEELHTGKITYYLKQFIGKNSSGDEIKTYWIRYALENLSKDIDDKYTFGLGTDIRQWKA